MTENKDWLFTNERQIYNFRGCGILICNNKILVQREENVEEFAIPGGQVKFGRRVPKR